MKSGISRFTFDMSNFYVYFSSFDGLMFAFDVLRSMVNVSCLMFDGTGPVGWSVRRSADRSVNVVRTKPN